jgi:putative transposase
VIFELKDAMSVHFLCAHFSVSRSGFYKWQKLKNQFQLLTPKQKICEQIKAYFEDSKETYGSPRIYNELKNKGIVISENTVAKYMREMGLDARLKKRYRVQTTDSSHAHPVAPRLFKVEAEHCLPSKPGEVLAGDITYLKLSKYNHVYLAVVLDLYNREVVGWSIGRTLQTRLVLDALHMAMRTVGPDAEVIFHSDRGVQYASTAYRRFLKNKNIKPSMSRKGNCYDNAYVESFFSSLKKEWVYRQNPKTEEAMKACVFNYIEAWYNKKRRHSSLDYLSPLDYRLKHNRTS